MRYARVASAALLGVLTLFATSGASPTRGACLLVDGLEVRYPDADTIFLGRVVGPGSTPRSSEVRVLDVYQGSVPRRIEMRNTGADCLNLRSYVGHRVVFVRVVDPEYGPYTLRWFEARDGYWIHKGAGRASLGDLLAYLGVRDLPPTSEAEDDRPDPSLPLGLAFAVLALVVVRFSSRAQSPQQVALD